MITHAETLGHYLLSFVLYTLGSVGVIYAVYLYLRRTPGGLAQQARRKQGSQVSLAIESALPLEPRKTLYVVRAGHERFLIAASGEATQLLSRLEDPLQEGRRLEESVSVAVTPKLEPPHAAELPNVEPWYAAATREPEVGKVGFGERFRQSLAWLATSRFK